MPSAARGIRRVRGGLRHDPWNLNRFTPAEGARRRGSRPAPAFRRSSEPCPRPRPPRPFRPVSDVPAGDYGDNFPGSTKVYVDGADGVRVPVRRIALSGGEPALASTTPAARSGSTSAKGCRSCAASGSAAARSSRASGASRPRRAHDMSEALKARTRRALRGTGAGDPAALRAPGRDHAGDGVHRHARGPRRRVRARRGRARPRHHPGQHQPPRARADDHRPQLPGEDQRQHRQLRRAARRSRRRSRSCAGRRSGAPTR